MKYIRPFLSNNHNIELFCFGIVFYVCNCLTILVIYVSLCCYYCKSFPLIIKGHMSCIIASLMKAMPSDRCPLCSLRLSEKFQSLLFPATILTIENPEHDQVFIDSICEQRLPDQTFTLHSF